MQTLEIHKLGPIEHCKIDISDFMVFTGEQSSGKSTVAKSIYFFKSIPTLIENELRRVYVNSSLPGDSVKMSLNNKLKKSIRLTFLRTFGSSWHMDSSMSLRYQYAEKVYIKIYLKDDPHGPNFISISFSRELTSFLRSIESQGWGNILKKKIRAFFNVSSEVIYIPAGRSMITLLSDQINYIYGFMDDAQKRDLDYCTKNYLELILRLKSVFSQDLDEMILDTVRISDIHVDMERIREAQRLIYEILRGKYQNASGEERLVLSDGSYVKINFASSGQQEAVWILNVIFYFLLNDEDTYFIIEEPESHLYPNTQKLIAEFIALARSKKNQMLVTTHSPYVLGTFNNLLYADGLRKMADTNALNRIIPSMYWIESSRFSAYYMGDGISKSCMDKEGRQIQNEVIDGASDDINRDFEEMLLLKQDIKEG